MNAIAIELLIIVLLIVFNGLLAGSALAVVAQFPGVARHVHPNEDDAISMLAGDVTTRGGKWTHTLADHAFIV